MAPFYPVAMNHLTELFGSRHAPRALAFGIGLCSLMVVIMHVTIGVATDYFGLRNALGRRQLDSGWSRCFCLLQPKTR